MIKIFSLLIQAYPTDQTCWWLIDAPVEKLIKISITNIDLFGSCDEDKIDVRSIKIILIIYNDLYINYYTECMK